MLNKSKSRGQINRAAQASGLRHGTAGGSGRASCSVGGTSPTGGSTGTNVGADGRGSSSSGPTGARATGAGRYADGTSSALPIKPPATTPVGTGGTQPGDGEPLAPGAYVAG